ncbi:hypothetical protein [Kibdelosporangium aridum]|nr:hypothetical protein [Kibdelosporangium aridum]
MPHKRKIMIVCANLHSDRVAQRLSSDAELSQFARKVYKDPAAVIGRREIALKDAGGVLKGHGGKVLPSLI